MNEKIEKMKKSSHLMAVLFKIFRVFAFVGIGITAASVIFLIAFPTGASIGDTNVLSGLSLNGQPIGTFEELIVNLPKILTLLCWMVFLLIIFYKTGAVFSDIEKTACPFSEVNVKRIRDIAIILLVASMVPNAVGALTALIVKAPNNYELFNGVGLSMGLVLICLSHVFDYGVQIQNENNELL